MKKRYLIFLTAVISLLAFGGITAVALGGSEFSANENRYLSQFPKISLSGIMSGDVQEDITDAFNDQFIKRDFWTAASTSAKKMLGYDDIGGVYLGKEHYYFEKIMNQDISQTNYFQNLRFVQFIAGKQEKAKVSVMLVPSPGTVLKDYLPKHATLYDAEKMYQEAGELLKDVNLIDLRQVLQEAGMEKQVYYKTDHHWSLRGAYIGYQNYCKSLGQEAKNYDGFGVSAVSDSFYGTLYSKVLDSNAVPDEIDAPVNLPEVTVYCDKKKQSGIYDSSKLDEKDKYAYFFGGNYGEADIVMNHSYSEKKLLIIKDSFANSMVPFMLEDYAEIKMLDLRYFKGSVQQLMEEYQADEVLVLYEISNFAQDENINKLIK